MTISRGEVWFADLNPIKGSEQAGSRPVLVIQNNAINTYGRSVIAIPFTTNLKLARLPSCVLVPYPEAGLREDSVLLCHQVRVLDISRLHTRMGKVGDETINAVERALLFTLGFL
jgi:mRNA interferase MazF